MNNTKSTHKSKLLKRGFSKANLNKLVCKAKRGSALAMSLILIMLLAVMCSTILMVTSQNYINAAAYRNNIKQYYTGENNLDNGLSEIRNILTDFDTMSEKYVKARISTKDSSISNMFSDIFSMTHDPDAILNSKVTISFSQNGVNDLNTFVSRTYLRWSAINGNATLDKKQIADFAQSVYTRLYYLLIFEAFSKGNCSVTIGDSTYELGNFLQSQIIKNTAEINTQWNASDSQSTQEGVYNINNDNGDYLDSVTNYTQDYSPSDTNETASNVTWINISYKSSTGNNNGGSGGDVNVKLLIKVPHFKFILSDHKEYNLQSHDTGINGVPAVSMSNAITAYGNIIVKDGAKVNINGDIYAKGQDLYDISKYGLTTVANATYAYAPATNVTDINKLLNYDPHDPSQSEYITDKDPTSGGEGLNTTDINSGGIRIGQAYDSYNNVNKPASADEGALLNVNGSLYTNDYVHTLGAYAKLNINNYNGNDSVTNTTDGDDCSGYNIKKDCRVDAYSGYPTDTEKNLRDVSFTDEEYKSVTDFPISFNSYRDSSFNSKSFAGGDAFCQKLITEEKGDGAAININGRAIIEGTLKTDAEHSNVYIKHEFYGLMTGSNSNLHSSIIQNAVSDPASEIKIDGRIYIPSTAFFMKEGTDLPTDYQTAESISSAGGGTISAYESTGENNEFTTYLKGTADGGPGYTIRNDEYSPFQLMSFQKGSNDSKNDFKDFSDYFIDYFLAYFLGNDELTNAKRISSVSTANVLIKNDPTSTLGMGYVYGTGIVKDDNNKTRILVKLPSSGSTAKADSWYNADSETSKATAMDKSKYTENGQFWDYYKGIILDQVFTPKTNVYYTGTYGGKENFDVATNLLSVSPVDSPNGINALIEKKAGSGSGDNNVLVISSSGSSSVGGPGPGVYVSNMNYNGTNLPKNVKSDNTANPNGDRITKFNIDAPGIIITDRDVIIKPGTTFKGALITTGNVIFDNTDADGKPDSSQTKFSFSSSAVYTKTSDGIASGIVMKVPEVAKALIGGNLNDSDLYSSANYSEEVPQSNLYNPYVINVAYATADISRFKVIGWKKP